MRAASALLLASLELGHAFANQGPGVGALPDPWTQSGTYLCDGKTLALSLSGDGSSVKLTNLTIDGRATWDQVSAAFNTELERFWFAGVVHVSCDKDNFVWVVTLSGLNKTSWSITATRVTFDLFYVYGAQPDAPP